MLQTAKIKVSTDKKELVDAVVMFDLGAYTSYISKILLKKCNPSWLNSKYSTYSSFGNSNVSNSQIRNVYDLNLIYIGGNKHSLPAVEVDVICPPLRRRKVSKEIIHSLSHLKLADDYDVNRDLNIDILIGVDYYWKFVSTNSFKCQDIVAHETMFGWILSGSCSGSYDTCHFTPSIEMSCFESQIDYYIPPIRPILVYVPVYVIY